jgi:hypothetical protein
MAPYPFENMFEHWLNQAPSLGVLLTWVMGGKGDFAVGEQIFMTMLELRLGSGLSFLNTIFIGRLRSGPTESPTKPRNSRLFFDY